MTRVAAIDCGTNSIRLLVSDIADREKIDLDRQMQIVRLGQGVDKSGRLAPEAVERTLAAARAYAATIERLGAERVAFCATSAARDAENGEEFADGIEAILGVRPQVISGDTEARLSFLGAARELPAGPILVVDIGGGSTELVVGDGEQVLSGTSVDVGSVRMTERFLHGDPPTEGEVDACASHLDDVLTAPLEALPHHDRVIGVAGTITTVAAHALSLPAYDSAALHGAQIPTADVRAACTSLVAMGVAERRSLGFMHPGRADVIGGGALVLDRVLAHVGEREFIVSEHDILDGIAWDAAR